jgi:uncharacterized membrane protein
MKLAKNWIVSFIGLFLMTFIWHNLILSDFYVKNLVDIGRYVNGTFTPLMAFLAIGNILAALGFAVMIPAAAKKSSDFVLYGFVMGLAVTGAFAMFSHAIFWGWTTNLMWADLSYGILSGIIMGWILSLMNKSNS